MVTDVSATLDATTILRVPGRGSERLHLLRGAEPRVERMRDETLGARPRRFRRRPGESPSVVPRRLPEHLHGGLDLILAGEEDQDVAGTFAAMDLHRRLLYRRLDVVSDGFFRIMDEHGVRSPLNGDDAGFPDGLSAASSAPTSAGFGARCRVSKKARNSSAWIVADAMMTRLSGRRRCTFLSKPRRRSVASERS